MENDLVFIDGVALGNYQGIAEDIQFIGPFQRFNFLIGKNNSGKSSILSFIAKHLGNFTKTQPTRSITNPPKEKLGDLDIHIGATLPQVTMGVGFRAQPLKITLLEEYPKYQSNLEEIVDILAIDEMIWVKRNDKANGWSILNNSINARSLRDLFSLSEWERTWCALHGGNVGGGDISTKWIPESIDLILKRLKLNVSKIHLIPAIRQISPKGKEFKDWTGTGLIEELAKHQNPGVQERDLYEKFKRINSFLQAVTQNETASIEIPHDREYVLVHMDGKVLPLESLGTGIHEIVMLAAFCTFSERQVICIEEPEIHLHPVLQRRFIQHLKESTTNQYIIATHSASFIDTPEAAIFHVLQENGSTVVKPVHIDSARFDVCRDLGYKASDFLQTNAIIWVEGPSDRIYIKHWIHAVAPEFIEGIHYSIMFYGGKLLSHLSADETDSMDEDIEALIAVRRLNRNIAIVIDSDKSKDTDTIRETKQRIKGEIEANGGICWITAGREIENYVSAEKMTDALREEYSNFGQRIRTGIYEKVLSFKSNDQQKIVHADKVKVAKAVCQQDADFDVLDLRERIQEIAELIRDANK